MRVLLTGGGTAGHINPAIAIAETIRDRDPHAVIEYVGTPKGLENKLVGAMDIPIHHVKIMGIARSLNPKNILAAYYILTAPKAAKKIIKKFKPDIVIGTGGYVCWPALRAASELGIPTMLHESNAVPGMAVKQLLTSTDEILVNFAGTAKYLKGAKKITVVGNPLRRGFRTGNRAEVRRALGLAESDTMILSFGGSLGAEMVNNACLDLMRDFSAKRGDVLHVHGTGARNYDKAKAKFDKTFKTAPENVRLLPYIDNMPDMMSAADIVISRAGAMTISELALAGKASILIPSPNVTNDHQYKNAKLLEDSNAAILVTESAELSSKLLHETEVLYTDRGLRQLMQNRILRFASRNSNDAIYAEIVRLVGTKK